jgi:hypothetical protein
MAAVGQGLDLGGKAGVGSQDVQLFDYGGIIVLVRVVGACGQQIVCRVAGAPFPLVDQADVLPKKAGRMATEGARAEGGALQVGSLEVGYNQLQQLRGEALELAGVVSACVGGGGGGGGGGMTRRVCPALAGCSHSLDAGRASRGGCTERVILIPEQEQEKECSPYSSSWR